MAKAKQRPVELPDVKELTRVLRLMSNPTRMQILLLLQDRERSLNELCEALDVPHPSGSHHLSLMKMSGVVADRREGKRVYYSLNRDLVGLLKQHFGGGSGGLFS